MPKRAVVVIAAAAFFGEAVPTQSVQADDEIRNLMVPRDGPELSFRWSTVAINGHSTG